jgi:hypothetical protein
MAMRKSKRDTSPNRASGACPSVPADDASIEGVGETIAELIRRWNAIPIGGSLKLAL